MTWTSSELSQYAADTRDLALPGSKNNSALRALQKTLTDPYARLHSIYADSLWVKSVLQTLPYPAVGNERCGTWYLNPNDTIPERAYFKSTDGHFGSWGFNLRRGNLQLVKRITEHGG